MAKKQGSYSCWTHYRCLMAVGLQTIYTVSLMLQIVNHRISENYRVYTGLLTHKLYDLYLQLS
jgi:hypothetical protein